MASQYISLVNFIMIIKNEFKKRCLDRSMIKQSLLPRNVFHFELRLLLNEYFFVLLSSLKIRNFKLGIFTRLR